MSKFARLGRLKKHLDVRACPVCHHMWSDKKLTLYPDCGAFLGTPEGQTE